MSEVITDTTIAGLNVEEIDQLQTLSNYTFQQSRYRLDQTSNILRQLFGPNYSITLISLIITTILLVILIALII
jgi:hypothetical protein